jgi:hypothetical protein
MADQDNELQLSAPGGTVRKSRKPVTIEQRLKSPALSMRLLGAFMLAYEKRWGFPYAVTVAEPRDLAIMKKLGAEWGEEAVASTVGLFFTSTDPQVQRCRFYNVPDFLYWAPKLRMAQSGGAVHEKTLGNVHEISKAMGRK